MSTKSVIRLFAVAVIFMSGCASAKPPAEPEEYTRSKMFQYLRSGQRDQIYCASTFITIKNGPQFYSNPIPKEREVWLRIARRYVDYLLKADKDIADTMIEGFPEYTVTWSHTFPPDIDPEDAVDDREEDEKGKD